ncbi:5-(carboxyamino)imidazole ribonucleotide synthase [Helcobacillus massiliensis]
MVAVMTDSAPSTVRTIGVVGGGQLARMMIPAAIELGLDIAVLAGSDTESAAQVAHRVEIGSHEDADAVAAFAASVDAVTFDHEHVPQDILRALEADGIAVRPGADALIHAQDKLVMRERLTELGHPCPQWWRITSRADLERALEEAGGRIVVKTARGGYDGHGVAVISSADEVADWLERGDDLLAEQLVPFTRELSAQVARRPGGQVAAYPVVESEQKDGVCFRVAAPAPGLSAERDAEIRGLAERIAEDLGVVGMLAVELFELADGTVLVNELAMRPHNTGHWSMDGCVTSQFEQHLRAVADLPLGSTEPLRPAAVMVNLLGGTREDLVEGGRIAVEQDPSATIHLYGKGVRPGRKVGHVNLTGEDMDEVTARGIRAAATIVDADD